MLRVNGRSRSFQAFEIGDEGDFVLGREFDTIDRFPVVVRPSVAEGHLVAGFDRLGIADPAAQLLGVVLQATAGNRGACADVGEVRAGDARRPARRDSPSRSWR